MLWLWLPLPLPPPCCLGSCSKYFPVCGFMGWSPRQLCALYAVLEAIRNEGGGLCSFCRQSGYSETEEIFFFQIHTHISPALPHVFLVVVGTAVSPVVVHLPPSTEGFILRRNTIPRKERYGSPKELVNQVWSPCFCKGPFNFKLEIHLDIYAI